MKIGRRTVLRGLALPLAWTLEIGSAKAFWRRDVDVLVVGAGGAGLAAGVAAAQEGASVLVLEKEVAIGGNTLRASGLFNAADPKRQGPMGVRDSVEWHAEQTLDVRADIVRVRGLAVQHEENVVDAVREPVE